MIKINGSYIFLMTWYAFANPLELLNYFRILNTLYWFYYIFLFKFRLLIKLRTSVTLNIDSVNATLLVLKNFSTFDLHLMFIGMCIFIFRLG